MTNQDRKKAVLKAIKDNPTARTNDIARGLLVQYPKAFSSLTCARKRVEYYRVGGSPQRVKTRYDGDAAEVSTSVRSLDIRSLEDSLREANVDLKVWEVERWVVNSWEVTTTAKKDATYTNFQVKVWLKRKISGTTLLALSGLLERVAKRAPKPPVRKPIAGQHLLEVSLFDMHLGMYAWNQETGNDYSLKIAEARFEAGMYDLVNKAKGFAPGRILLPIGNDFFHINNPEGTTPIAGNRLDVDTRYHKVYESGCHAVIRAIQYAASIAEVRVMWIPGNHDPQMSYHLCTYLAAWFRKDSRVIIDYGPKTRKYYHFGNTLLGFTHGDKENHSRLPLLMATENPVDYGTATTREWHVGHLHKERETRFVASNSEGDVVVRVLPSLTGTDAWHFQQGYVKNNKVAEAYVYEKSAGLVAKFWTHVAPAKRA
jgi:hypothetical protein